MRIFAAQTSLLALILLLGCGGGYEDTAGTGDGGGSCELYTLELSIAPQTVSRGADVTLELLWQLTSEVSEPLVTLRRAEVEVDLPMTLDEGAEAPTYIASQLNPYGLGAPAGEVSVLARAELPAECDSVATATTAFFLE